MAVYGIQWVQGTGEGRVYNFPEATSQTFFKGQFVLHDATASGRLAGSATDTTVIAGGIALATASGTTDTEIPVLIFSPGQIFSVSASNAGANATASHSSAMLGETYSFILSSEANATHLITLDSADAGSNDWFKVIAKDPRDEWDTSGGRFLVVILPAVYAAHTT